MNNEVLLEAYYQMLNVSRVANQRHTTHYKHDEATFTLSRVSESSFIIPVEHEHYKKNVSFVASKTINLTQKIICAIIYINIYM